MEVRLFTQTPAVIFKRLIEVINDDQPCENVYVIDPNDEAFNQPIKQINNPLK